MCATAPWLPPRGRRSVRPEVTPADPLMPDIELYLVRHAIAAERGAEWPDDTKRPLTVRGMARFKDAVRGLHRLDIAHGRNARVRRQVARVAQAERPFAFHARSQQREHLGGAPVACAAAIATLDM